MGRACLLGLFAICGALAAPKLYLKNRVIDPSSPVQSRVGKRRAETDRVGRLHWIAQYDRAPTSDDIQILAGRGATVLGYVHENGLIISADASIGLDDLGLRWLGNLEPADKISPLLPIDSPDPVLIEFHPDIDLNDARTLLSANGAVLVDHPNLNPHHLLARLTAAQLEALAERDEIAYFLPASPDLVSGRPAIACLSGLTLEGAAAQYIPMIGDGWDGPGLNAATIGYYFSSTTGQVPEDTVRSEVLRAYAEWAKYVKVSFVPASAPDALQMINVLFAKGQHGDGYAFDGPGGVLAHTFYPAPPNPEPIAGDMHFDDAETWRVGTDKDLFSVALHEAGHALGLGHSDRPGTVMYPYYAIVNGLTADDIAAAQNMYAAQDTPSQTPSDPSPAPDPTPPPNPPTPPAPTPPAPLSLSVAPVPAATASESLVVTGSLGGLVASTILGWTSDRGQSGYTQPAAAWSAQIPLAIGGNTITFTAADGRRSVSQSVVVKRNPAPAPVAIQFSYPAGTGAFTTSQSTIDLRGSASHPSGIQSVRWSSDTGPAGPALGTTAWDSGSIALSQGLNNITVYATANDGSFGQIAVKVTYFNSGARDTTAPSITITNPASATIATTADSIVVKGAAADNTGVTSVIWFTSNGAGGNATGTTNWSTPPIPLILGDNTITIRAFDAAGNMSWRVVLVSRR